MSVALQPRAPSREIQQQQQRRRSTGHQLSWCSSCWCFFYFLSLFPLCKSSCADGQISPCITIVFIAKERQRSRLTSVQKCCFPSSAELSSLFDLKETEKKKTKKITLKVGTWNFWWREGGEREWEGGK